MNGEALILQFYEFNGQAVTVEQLKKYHNEVQAYVDSIGHGPYVPKLIAINGRVIYTIKDWKKKRITEVAIMEIAPDKIEPKPKIYGAPTAVSAGEIRDIFKKELFKFKAPKQKKVESGKLKVESVKKKTLIGNAKESFKHKSRGKKLTKKVKTKSVGQKVSKMKVSKKKRAVLKGVTENKSLPLPKKAPDLVILPAEAIPKNNLVDASALAGITYREIPLNDKYKKDFQRILSDSQIMISGLPGSGKSVYVLNFAQFFAELNLKTLYIAHEEYGRSTFAEKLKTFSIGNPNLKFAPDFDESIIDQFDVIFFDSVNSAGLSLKDYQRIHRAHPGKIYVLILQSTKDGDFRGGKDWEHEVDIAGQIVNRKLILTKNRLDPDNSKKAEKLLKEEMISDKKKKIEINQAVKDQMEPKQIEPEIKTQAA